MSAAKGSKSKLGFAEESTYGTMPASLVGLTFVSESLGEDIERIISDEIQDDRTVPNVRGGNVGAGGDIQLELGTDRLMKLLEHVLSKASTSPGNPSTVSALAEQTYYRGEYVSDNSNHYLATVGGAVSAGEVTTGLSHTSGEVELASGAKFEYVSADSVDVYQHQILGGNAMPTGGISIEKQIVGAASPLLIQYLGGRINSLDINIPQSDKVTAGLGFLFQKATKNTGSAVTSAYDSDATGEEAIVGRESAVLFSTDGGTTWDTTVRPIREASISIQNNMEEDVRILTSRERRDIPEGRREINGNMTTYFESSAEYDFFKNETELSLKFSFVHGGRVLEFIMHEVKLTGNATPQVAGPGIITQAFDWMAYRQSAAQDITVNLFTSESSIR